MFLLFKIIFQSNLILTFYHFISYFISISKGIQKLFSLVLYVQLFLVLAFCCFIFDVIFSFCSHLFYSFIKCISSFFSILYVEYVHTEHSILIWVSFSSHTMLSIIWAAAGFLLECLIFFLLIFFSSSFYWCFSVNVDSLIHLVIFICKT